MNIPKLTVAQVAIIIGDNTESCPRCGLEGLTAEGLRRHDCQDTWLPHHPQVRELLGKIERPLDPCDQRTAPPPDGWVVIRRNSV